MYFHTFCTWGCDNKLNILYVLLRFQPPCAKIHGITMKKKHWFCKDVDCMLTVCWLCVDCELTVSWLWADHEPLAFAYYVSAMHEEPAHTRYAEGQERSCNLMSFEKQLQIQFPESVLFKNNAHLTFSRLLSNSSPLPPQFNVGVKPSAHGSE